LCIVCKVSMGLCKAVCKVVGNMVVCNMVIKLICKVTSMMIKVMGKSVVSNMPKGLHVKKSFIL
jgi:hypothetical protein